MVKAIYVLVSGEEDFFYEMFGEPVYENEGLFIFKTTPKQAS